MVNPHQDDKMKIETAARNGDVATLQELYSNGIDVTDVVSDQVSNTVTFTHVVVHTTCIM